MQTLCTEDLYHLSARRATLTTTGRRMWDQSSTVTEEQDTNQVAPSLTDSSEGPVSREALYEMVWSEPMLRVAARFGVSSSYMARVCTLLNVPRPERGYWAKLAVGKAPKQPPLPEPRPGDPLEWRPDGALPKRARPLPKPPDQRIWPVSWRLAWGRCFL